jgi:hypothetical protein
MALKSLDGVTVIELKSTPASAALLRDLAIAEIYMKIRAGRALRDTFGIPYQKGLMDMFSMEPRKIKMKEIP